MGNLEYQCHKDEVFKRDGYKCLACGSTEFLTLDHIVPQSKGGTHEAENLQTLCNSCNAGKGTYSRDYRKPIRDWRSEILANAAALEAAAI